MKKYLYLLFAVTLVTSCIKVEEPDVSYLITNHQEIEQVYFTIDSISPLSIYCKAEYTGVTKLEWDFGDGEKGGSEANINHHYKNFGEYKVTLIGYTKSGNKTAYSQKIKLIKPSYIYIKGFRFDTIPYENKYYRVHMYNDLWGTDWKFDSGYTPILTGSKLPYTLSAKKIMDKLDIDDYYTVIVYYNSSASGTGTEVFRTKIYKETIYGYYPGIACKNNGLKIGVLFDYK